MNYLNQFLNEDGINLDVNIKVEPPAIIGIGIAIFAGIFLAMLLSGLILKKV